MSDETIEFTSRYDALGPPNGCAGDCEGTGFIPHVVRGVVEPDDAPNKVTCVFGEDLDPPIYRVLWFLAEAKSPNPPGDDWHFVPCPDCRPNDPMVQLARKFIGA